MARRAAYERLVVVHTWFPRTARAPVGVRFVQRSGDRSRPPRTSDCLPADDLQHVLETRNRRYRSLDSRRHATDSCRVSRARAPHGLPARDGRLLVVVDGLVHRGARDAYVVRRAGVFPISAPAPQLGNCRGRRPRHRVRARRGARHPVLTGRAALHSFRLPRAARGCGFLRIRGRQRPEPDRPDQHRSRRVRRDVSCARSARCPAQGRPRPSVARLRRLACQLRPGVTRVGGVRAGSVRAVDFGSFAPPHGASISRGPSPARDGACVDAAAVEEVDAPAPEFSTH